jgi:hypothetical protein
MQTVDGRGVSMRIAKKLWERVKGVLEYAHLCDYLLSPAHSQILTLLLFGLRMPAGWLVLGWFLAAYFFLQLVTRGTPPPERKRTRKSRDHTKCKPAKPVARKAAATKRKKVQKRKE